jgi:serine/threonine protein kinase/Tol biopolymer transport system component
VNAERLQKVSPIFRQAVELSPDERAAFLASSCEGDATLREDVESLLSAHERAGSFIESPAYERAAELLTDEPAASIVGQLIAHYRIVAPLGSGGMGEVYLARDTKLERSVALKFLPSDVASDKERMRRFTREAKAAAALNHPNIAHIYEIGETAATHFIAMEYVDGVTLSEKIHRVKTPLGQLLKYLTQVAEGLAKAHAAGIVHRDLKPDNIMITRDHYAKILDFGLAKLVEPQRASGEERPTSGETATAILAQHSMPGMIMGTAGYMSPEQAQGKVRELDHRSDIFSFGCILFEAATRQRAFEGQDPLDSLHKIVHAPVPQIKDFNSSAPDELQRIVRRCLAKEPDKRYQSIKEVAIELDELRQELKERAELNHSIQPQTDITEPPISSQGAQTVSTQQPTAHTTKTETAHSTSSAEYLVSGIKSHKLGVLLALIGMAVTVAMGLGLYKYYWSRPTKPLPFQEIKLTKLTFNGKARSAVISRDGKQVVYTIEDGGRRSLWLRQVATGTDVKLTEPENIGYFGLTISPDGNFLYYAHGGSVQNRILFRMPVLGGSPTKVVENISTPIGFSPDGKQIAFARSGQGQGESALIIANADGTEERKISERKGGPNRFGNFFFGGVAWSPDGKRIATIARARDSAGRYQNVVEVPVEGGEERVLTSQRWYQIQRLAWLADGSGLLITAAEKASEAQEMQIWHLSYPDAEARKITNTLNGYTSISLNADSSVLVTVQQNQAMDIWVAPDGDAGRATQFKSVSSNMDGLDNVRWTPDGKIVFHSMAGGRDGIWIMDADGKNRKQLTTAETVDYDPSVTTDGRYVVFTSERTGAPVSWVMNVDGSNQKNLEITGFNPQAGDGWVVYPDSQALWKAPIAGGEPVRLTEERLLRCGISHDGKMVACSLEAPGSPIRLAVLPIDGGTIKVFDVKFKLPARIRWMPDGRAVSYIGGQDGLADIWSQPLDGGEPKRLTNFKADAIFSFDWSRDNKLVISHGISASDVVLIRNAK